MGLFSRFRKEKEQNDQPKGNEVPTREEVIEKAVTTMLLGVPMRDMEEVYDWIQKRFGEKACYLFSDADEKILSQIVLYKERGAIDPYLRAYILKNPNRIVEFFNKAGEEADKVAASFGDRRASGYVSITSSYKNFREDLFKEFKENVSKRQNKDNMLSTRANAIKEIVFEGILKSPDNQPWDRGMIENYISGRMGGNGVVMSALDEEILYKISLMKKSLLDYQMREYMTENPGIVVDFVNFVGNDALETAAKNQYTVERARGYIDLNGSYNKFKKELLKERQHENDRPDYPRSYRSMDDGFDR